MSVANLAAALFFSLLFSSAAIAYFATEMHVADNQKFHIEGLTPPESYNISAAIVASPIQYGSGGSTWYKTPDIGYITLGSYANYLTINGIQKNNGWTTNHYKINNSVGAEYNIILDMAGEGGYRNSLMIKNDGIHIPMYISLGKQSFTDIDFIPIANFLSVRDVDITTKYNYELQTVIITVNGQEHTVTGLNQGLAFFNILLQPEYLAGVYTNGAGFNLVDFNSDNGVNTKSSSVDAISQIFSFITTMFTVVLWNLPESMFPAVLNLILIKTQASALIICVIVIIRGATG